MRLLRVDPLAPDPRAIADAAAVLRGGGLVAFATETVYGLGANAVDDAAVARVFQAKGRPAEDPLIVHVLDIAGTEGLVGHWPPLAWRLAAAFWPGPLTLVLPRGPAVAAAVSAGRDSVAVRAPSHPVARALIAAAGLAVAAPSANRFGHTSPTTAAHVAEDLGEWVDLLLDAGPAPGGMESTVVDARGEEALVLRPGAVTLEALRAVTAAVRPAPSAGAHGPQVAPGQLARHYAPEVPLVWVTGPEEAVAQVLARATTRLAADGQRVGLLVADEDLPELAQSGAAEVRALAARADLVTAARELYAALRAFEAAGVDLILARDWGTAGLGLALADRLMRAAEGRVVAVTAPTDAALSDVVAAARRGRGPAGR